MMTMRIATPSGFALVTTLALAPSLWSQGATNTTVPAAYRAAEGPNSAFWAISPFVARRQLLIDERHLLGVKGKRIRSIWMRRNAGDRSNFGVGSVILEVSLSHARTVASRADSRFARNRGTNVALSFSGKVILPASAPPKKAPSPWTVEIRLTKPFLYGGGTLCVETVTTPVVSRTTKEPAWWPIDAVTRSAGGTVTNLGVSCITGMGRQPAGADASGFVPGSTATMFLRGRTNATGALCFLGLNSSYWGAAKLPMNLSRFGAPGCHVYVDLRIPILLPLTKLSTQGISYASWSVLLPNSPTIVGLSLYSQWVVGTRSNNFGLATSNGVRAVIGTTASIPGISWIESSDPKQLSGSVLKGRVPVLRFTAQ
jgi:hypothetical protein